MATLVCTVTYDKRHQKVIKEFQIRFDKSDKFELKTATKDLALKVERENAAAKKLIERWRQQNGVKAQSIAVELPDVYIPNPVEQKKTMKLGQKKTIRKEKLTKFCASFAVPTAALAKFECGYFETHPEPEFERYRGGAGQHFPDPPPP